MQWIRGYYKGSKILIWLRRNRVTKLGDSQQKTNKWFTTYNNLIIREYFKFRLESSNSIKSITRYYPNWVKTNIIIRDNQFVINNSDGGSNIELSGSYQVIRKWSNR